MDGPPAVRVVRPRPLGLTDRIPVYWAGQEPTQELKAIDGGALYRHLIAASTPTGNKKRKRGQKYQAPKEGAPHEHFLAGQDVQQQQQSQEAAGPIHIPRVRLVADYDLNQEAAEHHGPMIEGDMAAAPYLRHKEHLDMYDEHHTAEYDADDADIKWLDNINSKNGQGGILAAAIGLYHQVSARISGSGSLDPSGSERQHAQLTQQQQQQQPQQQPLRLSVDDFERAIELLEKAHYDAVKAWWDEDQAGPSSSAPRVPKIPSMKTLLPRAEGLDVLSGLVADRKLAAQVLDYWLKKRIEEGGPLLARLWFEQPWKLVAFAHDIVDDDEDFDEHLPFMAVEPRSKQKTSRRGGQRRKVNEEDAQEALYGLRNELETVRTLADQVRKREKLKRQLLLLSQQEWQTRRQLGLPPGKVGKGKAGTGKAAAGKAGAGTSKVPAGSNKAAAAGTSKAGTSKAAAAGTSKPAAAGTSKAGTSKAAATGATKAGTSRAAAAGTSKAPKAGRGPVVTGPSPRAGAGGAWAGAAAGGRAAAAASLPSPPGSPNTELNKALARVALAAAAAASPHEGDKGRQTRTAAAAAAAEFELTFAAKRRRLLADKADSDAAAATVAPAAAAAGGKGAAAAAAAAGGPAAAGPSRLQKRSQPEAAAAGSKPAGQPTNRAPAQTGKRKGGAAAAAAAGGGAAGTGFEDVGQSQGVSSPSPSAVSNDSEADYEADDEVSSEDTELPSGLVYETAAVSGRQQQQQQVKKGRQKKQLAQGDRKGRGGSRAAAAAAKAAAGAIAADEADSDVVIVDDDEVDSQVQQQQQQQQQGQARGTKKPRQSKLVPEQQQQQHKQKRPADPPKKGGKLKKQQQDAAAGAARGSRQRNGFVLPPVASSSELQADVDSDSDSFMTPRKKRKPSAAAAVAAPPAAAAGRRLHAAAEAGGQADAVQVLKPLNQQPKQLRGQTDSHKAVQKSVSPAEAAPARAVAASSGRGAVPVSGGNKGHGSGGSVRRSNAAGAAAGRAAEVPKRRQRPPAARGGVGQAELRSLGVFPDAAVTHTRRKAT